MNPSGKFYDINGLRLKVYVKGEGKPLLLLHGFPDSAKLWEGMAPYLVEAGFQLIMIDQRGFGESDAPKGVKNYKLKHIESDALKVLDALNIQQKVGLIGHDWGAAAAWNLAVKYPGRFDRLMALSVGHLEAFRRAGIRQKLLSWYMVFIQLRGIPESLYSRSKLSFLHHPFQNYGSIGHGNIIKLAKNGRLTGGLNWYRANVIDALLTKHHPCTIPAMGVWSTGDVALVEEQMTNSAKYMEAEWRYERIENSSHWIPLDQPEKTAQLAIDWFKQEEMPSFVKKDESVN